MLPSVSLFREPGPYSIQLFHLYIFLSICYAIYTE